MKDQTKKVLLIFDERFIANSIKSRIESLGLNVSIATNTERGLLRAKAFQFEMLIVEWEQETLPASNFIESIRKAENYCNVPILFILKNGAALGEKVIQFSSVDFIRLPIDSSEIKFRISKLFNTSEPHSKKVKTEPANEKIEKSTIEKNGTKRILLVDDNQFNLKIFGMFLTKLGREFDVANDGKVAIEFCQKNEYSTILMDIFMPEVDGLEATREIRKIEIEKGHNVSKIIAISANESNDNVNLCFDVGMNDYLVKPFTIEALKEKIV